MAVPPNILWLFCEDLCPWLSLYGDHTVATPHLDALAARGVIFQNCFSPSPVCSPTRSGLITGQMPTSIGVHNHHSCRSPATTRILPPNIPTLPALFRAGGYETFNFGKDDYNFTYDRGELYSGPYKNLGFYGPHALGNSNEQPSCPDWRFWRQVNPAKPFFGQITLWAGKNKKRARSPVDPATVQVPSYYPDTSVTRSMIARHYEQIAITDEEVGEIMAQLEADGLAEKTAVFFFSDHGYQLLRHKQFLYDGGIHVPLIVSAPCCLPMGTRRRDLVSLIDVAAASLSLAGLPIPSTMESRDIFAPNYHRDVVIAARDRCDFTIDRIRALRTERYKYIRNFLTDRPLFQPQYRDRDPQYREFFQLQREGHLTPAQAQFASPQRPPEELYDLATDPDETDNLADDPAYAGVLADLRDRLALWVQATNDQGQYPESEAQLREVMEIWGDRCINPEFQRLRR